MVSLFDVTLSAVADAVCEVDDVEVVLFQCRQRFHPVGRCLYDVAGIAEDPGQALAHARLGVGNEDRLRHGAGC